MIGQRGSIFMLTLWVLIMLSIFSVIISKRASTDIRLAKYESENIKALYLAKAGVMKMIAELAKDTNAYDSLDEDWHKPKEFQLGGGIVSYSASDEKARLNLNSHALQKEYLVRLGIDEIISQRVMDYKTSKGGKGFEFMEELFLIEGMTPEIYSNIKDYITIYRGIDSKININTASENVLQIAVGDNKMVQDILEYRKGADEKEGTIDDGIFENTADISTKIEGLNLDLFTVGSNFFRIWASASFSEDKKIIKKITSVADRAGKIYYWKED